MDRPIFAANCSDLLKPAKGFAGEAVQSMLYSWQNMAQASVDLVDFKGCLPRLQLIDKPAEAAFGTSDWAAQHLGNAVGIAVPFYFLHKGVQVSTDKLFGKLTEQSIRREVAMASTTGFLFGTALTPVSSTDTRNYYQARVENGLTLGLSVGVMTYSALKIQAGGEALKSRSPLLGGVIKSDIVSGALSGIPGGLAFAEMNALTTHRRLLPTATEVGDSMVNFGLVGTALGLPGTIKGKPMLPAPIKIGAP